MKQKLLKTMLLLCTFLVGIGAWADSESFSYSDHKGKGTYSTGSEYTMVGTDISITNSKFYCGSSSSYAQFYANGTTTITPGSGITITEIVLTASSSSYNGYQSGGEITASTGSVSGSGTTVTWTGSATSAFTLSNNKQIRWTSIVVTYTSSGGGGSTCAVTYDGNGADSGTAPTDANSYSSGATVTVLDNTGSLTKTGYSFDGWNTSADGSGTDRAVGSTFSITANTTLYAKWIDSRTETSVIIDGAGITNRDKYSSTEAGSYAATVKDDSENVVDGATITWSSSNTGVATINESTGAVTLVGEGKTTITANYAGNASYKASSSTCELIVTNSDPSIVTIWSEDFSGYAADDVPSGSVTDSHTGTTVHGDVTLTYACTNGTKTSGSTNGGTTAVKNDNLAGGAAALELLVGRKGSGDGALGGTFTATIPLLTSTYGYEGDLILKYKTNANSLNVKTTTDGVTVYGEASAGAGVSFNSSGEHTITFKGVTTSTESITIVFTATTSNNVRLDDIVLKGAQAELTKVATPSISPSGGAVVSGQEVTITCVTDGTTIYYTTDGTIPSSSSTSYDPANKPTITANTILKAIAVKDGLTDSEVASASYTIALPCATPMFSVASGEVTKGTTVTISTEEGATIYYTTNGDTPTTSSNEYSGAITINTAQTIKAIAVKDGMANSTVASASYTIIDYASLPFSWVGNSSTPTGITNNAVGTYDSSPYLKFDNTGDYIILKMNEAPDMLKFDIKGNSFSGGTFKVQYSADGSSYSDLKSYTSLGDQSTEKFTSIPSTTRYIKWIYTTKSSGNVALGNIKAYKCESVTVTSVGYATFASSNVLDFTDASIKAYIAEPKGTTGVTFSQVYKIPANTGVLLYKDGGTTEEIPITNESTDYMGNNVFVKGTGAAVVSVDGNLHNYILNNVGGNIGFYKANGQTVATNRAYIQIDESIWGAVKEFISLPGFEEDEADSINEELRMKNEESSDGVIFNLAGQRLSKMQKGINIINGKKIFVK